jgi:hypothetical protein
MISTRRSRSCWRISCAAAAVDGSDQPGLGGVRIGNDIDRRLDRIGAEQLSRAAEQSSHFVELLLQRRISHVPTLLTP